MTKKETKRQHFVPRTYLKYFSTERKGEFYINALPISSPTENKIYEPNIANVALQKDLYTLPGETKEERLLIEKFYQENYEDHYDQAYKILIDPSKKTVTEEERNLIISTVVTMLYRTTKWISSYNEFMKRVIHNGFNLAKETDTNYLMLENEKISIAGKTEEELANEFKLENRPRQVITQLEVALRLVEVRSFRDGINVVKLDDHESEFITSDNPVTYSRVEVNEILPFDPKNVLSLPLDNKHKLMLMPYADTETKNLIIRSNYNGNMCYTQKLTSNFEQWKNAEKFIFGTKSSLKSYLSTKEETEKPLTEEELKKVESRRKAFEEVLKKAKDLGLI